MVIVTLLPKKNYVEFDYENFINKRKLWNKLNIENYEFDIETDTKHQFHYNTHIIVKNGSFYSKITNDEYMVEKFENSTINDIFNEIEERFNRSNRIVYFFDGYVRSINIEYNEQYYYPEIVIYYNRRIPFATDQGPGYRTIIIKNFKIL